MSSIVLQCLQLMLHISSHHYWKGRFPDFVNGTRVNTVWTENTICKRELFNTRICSNRSNYVNCVLYVRELIWNVVFSLCYMRTFKQSSFTKVSFKMKSLSFIQEQPFCRIIQRVWLLQRKINLSLLSSLNQTQYLNYSIFKLSTSVFVVDVNCLFVCLLHLKKKNVLEVLNQLCMVWNF